jgi:hypothetical protein
MKYISLSFNPSIKTLKNFSSDADEIFTALTINFFLNARRTVTGEILSGLGINE